MKNFVISMYSYIVKRANGTGIFILYSLTSLKTSLYIKKEMLIVLISVCIKRIYFSSPERVEFLKNFLIKIAVLFDNRFSDFIRVLNELNKSN